jgi:hypothetical protein
LRPLFQVPPIPWYLYVQGSVLTGWSVLFVVQATLISRRRTELHHRLGVFGPLLAVTLPGLVELPFNLVFVLGLPLSLVVNDLWTTRRLRAATAWGTAAYVLITVFAGHAMAPTPVGRALRGMLE